MEALIDISLRVLSKDDRSHQFSRWEIKEAYIDDKQKTELHGVENGFASNYMKRKNISPLHN